MNVTGTGTPAITEPPVPVPCLWPCSEGQGNEDDLLQYVGSGVVTKAQQSSRRSLSPESKTQQAQQEDENSFRKSNARAVLGRREDGYNC